jgi:hypothetical protein
MNEHRIFLLTAFGVLLTFLSFYTMPIGITFIIMMVSFILGVRGFIMHVRIVNKRLFKSDDHLDE